MAKKRVSKSADNWKKKKWYSIAAPSQFAGAQVGETFALEKEMLLGKKVTQNVMALTGEVRKKDLHVTFQIDTVQDDTAQTSMIGYEMVPGSIKRQVRRGRDRLDDSLLIKSQDGKVVRVKPFVVTRGNTKSSVHKLLRYSMRKYLLDYLAGNSFDTFATEVLTRKFQKSMSTELQKVYPIRTCEIRRFDVVPETKKTRLSTINVKVKERASKPAPEPQTIEVPEAAPEQEA